MRLEEGNKFIDGGFMSSMVTRADIAVATLQTEIVLSDTISPICLPGENKTKTAEVLGKYSGWSATHKVFENFNSSLVESDDKFNEARPKGKVDFGEGMETFVR